MSAQPEKVQSIEEALSESFRFLTRLDTQLHTALDGLNVRLLALDMARDPEVLEDLDLLRQGKIDLNAAMDPREFAAKVRAHADA